MIKSFAKIFVPLFLLLNFIPTTYAGDESAALPQSVLLNVPFSTQAPLGEWSDRRQLDGCEETSVKMAMMWAYGQAAPAEEVRRDIINMSEFERVTYGSFEDTSAVDTANLFQSFYGYNKVSVAYGITTPDIKLQLAAGHLVLIPLNTRLLKNKFYRRGPPRHTVVVVGYDNQSHQMIINDPFYSFGHNIHVKESELQNALGDYKTGMHLATGQRTKAMIVVSK